MGYMFYKVFLRISLNVDLSLNQTPDNLALCETNLIDSDNFCEGLSFLNKKDSITHVHSFVVYAKEGLPFTREASLENFVDSYLCFQLASLHSVPYFFYSVDHLLRHCARFLTLFHLTYMRLSHQPICY